MVTVDLGARNTGFQLGSVNVCSRLEVAAYGRCTQPLWPLTDVPKCRGVTCTLATATAMAPWCDAGSVTDRNVFGGELEPCGTNPLTGFFRDGCCSTGREDIGSHTICAVVTAEFLDHQRGIGNDLSAPQPQYGFRGLVPGDRWCVTAVNWARAFNDGVAAPVRLASTNEAVLAIVPLAALHAHAVDVPADPSSLDP